MTVSGTELLVQGLGPIERRLTSGLHSQLEREFRVWLQERSRLETLRLKSVPRAQRHRYIASTKSDRRQGEFHDYRSLLDFLLISIPEQIEKLISLRLYQQDFRQTLALATDEEERKRLILEYAKLLGRSRRQERRDRSAVDRWFGEAAIMQRYRRRLGRAEQFLEYSVRRLGDLIQQVVAVMHDRSSFELFWERTKLDSVLEQVAQYEGDVRISRAVFHALQTSVSRVDRQIARSVLDGWLERGTRIASSARADLWLQTAALELVCQIDPDRGVKIIERRFSEPLEGDDMFFRRKGARLLSLLTNRCSAWWSALSAAATDPSPFVRQQLAERVWALPSDAAKYYLSQMIGHDPSPQVRAAAIASPLNVDVGSLEFDVSRLFATTSDVTKSEVQHVADARTQASERSLSVPDLCLLRVHDPNSTQVCVGDDRGELLLAYLYILAETLEAETETFVLRTALFFSERILVAIVERKSELSLLAQHRIWTVYRDRLLPAIRRLQRVSPSIPVRRWCAEAAEGIWVQLDEESLHLESTLKKTCSSLKVGESMRISIEQLGGAEERLLGRVLANLARADYGFDVERTKNGFRVSRPPHFDTRIWRIWHEFWSPSTEKRQAFPHTIGRVSAATVRAPSRILAELSQTKVPGEPLFIAEEGGWRPYLPLVDDLLSVLTISRWKGNKVQFFTSEGVTTVAPPAGIGSRAMAWYRLTFGFPRIASLRNWTSLMERSPTEYLRTVENLGFSVQFQTYAQFGRRHRDPGNEDQPQVELDSSVARFFPQSVLALIPLCQVPSWKWIQPFREYFGSMYENSLSQLILFAGTLLVVFLCNHLWSNWQVRRNRNRIPLRFGGWGTRGKSGTERLKAALISGMGYSLISKTTGCEAMFLMGETYGPTRELPLFRPLDKATIWEHTEVLAMAARLESTVFLWECMGLNPEYVNILQRCWTRDDLATVTNAYPDHEDIQGPAGWNVATTISGFIPVESIVATTEQQMLPLLHDACRQVGTSLRHLGWLQSGLIPPEVLDRFSYNEHPDNIALVASLAGELGVDRDFALKEMADNLIADLGVLRTFPAASINTRQIQFINGMSANERLGCMGNWERTGMARQSPKDDPGTWVCTVVNNRADRVARSKVFAAVLVEDLSADRHFLIGSNLGGLLGFIDDAWNARYRTFSPWNEGEASCPEEVWTRQAEWMRQPTDEDQVKERVTAMLDRLQEFYGCLQDSRIVENCLSAESFAYELADQPIPDDIKQSISQYQAKLCTGLTCYREHLEKISRAQGADREQVAAGCVAQLREWFDKKIVVVENSFATGDEVIQTIVDATPPGLFNRVMGLQNIKGTGLGFVYAWTAWLDVWQACEDLDRGEETRRARGAETLMNTPRFGVLSRQRVSETVQRLRQDRRVQSIAQMINLDSIEQRLMGDSDVGSDTRESTHTSAWMSTIVNWIEDLWDALDGVRRRRSADRIYRDLQDEQISVDEAILLLRDLNARQKGGWLWNSLQAWRPRRKQASEAARDKSIADQIEDFDTVDSAGPIEEVCR